jgi:hypothetical protein
MFLIFPIYATSYSVCGLSLQWLRYFSFKYFVLARLVTWILYCLVCGGCEIRTAVCSVGNGTLSQGLKQPQREANHSAPSSAKLIQNTTIIPLHYLSYWHAHGRVFISSYCQTLNVPMHLTVFFSMALRPNSGHGLLLIEVSRSHTTTYHSR